MNKKSIRPDRHLGIIKSLSKFLYGHFRKIIVYLVLIIIILQLLVNYIPALRLTTFILLDLAFFILIPNFIINKGLESIYHLIGNKNMTIEHLIGDYCLAVLSAILFFMLLYGTMESLKIGYLQYGNCSANFNINEVSNNPSLTVSPLNRIYFSAITFFTVGYGDICPMGYSKLISIFNALTGTLVNIIIISIAIGQYLTSGRKN